ncbi:hypothetical protein SRHO_G00122020 [Serrasalmus rhombeus]
MVQVTDGEVQSETERSRARGSRKAGAEQKPLRRKRASPPSSHANQGHSQPITEPERERGGRVGVRRSRDVICTIRRFLERLETVVLMLPMMGQSDPESCENSSSRQYLCSLVRSKPVQFCL